ncbi:hypothetical protein EVAR_54551_1 [Eumeta japonica]|uniref:Uncharacterized protein n=1 Tax=Eumeta variegata TaxID=151549 RepID=A0A4C1YUA6_EUMVA|nr:hypothetical protein EVAR_54551_1 [Eumeta japonica]
MSHFTTPLTRQVRIAGDEHPDVGRVRAFFFNDYERALAATAQRTRHRKPESDYRSCVMEHLNLRGP